MVADLAAYQATVLAESGLVSYYPCDETSGTTATDRKGSNNGTYTGPLIGKDLCAPVRFRCADFDGVDDRIELGDPVNLRFTSALTLEALIWVDAFTNNVIIGRQGSWEMDLNTTGRLEFSRHSSTWSTTTSANGVVPAGLAHVAATYDTATVSMYVNGAVVKTASVSGTCDAIAGNLCALGASAGGTALLAFKGAHFALYNTVLTAAKINAHARAVFG